MIARLAARIRRDDHGVTLVEVSLTMLILSILLVMAFDFLDRTTNITVKTDTHARAEDDTQRALRTVTQHIRGAYPIQGTCATAGYPSTYKDCVRFSVPRNGSGYGGCQRSEFVIGLVDAPDPAPVDERHLVYDRLEHTTNCNPGTFSAYDPTSPQNRVLLARVVNTASQPLFTYYSNSGAAIDTTTAAGMASIPQAATVNVTLHVRYRTGSNAIELLSAAALRNNITR